MTDHERRIAGIEPIPALDGDDEDFQALLDAIEDAGYSIDYNRWSNSDVRHIAVDSEDSEAIGGNQ